MLVPLVVAGAAGAAALALKKGEEKPAATTLPTSERPPSGVPATPPALPAKVGAPTSPAPAGDAVAGELLAKAGRQVLERVAGASAATVIAGFQVQDMIRQGVGRVAGEGLGNLAAVNPVFAVGALAKEGTQRGLEALGVPAPAVKVVSQTVGMAAAAGPLFAPAVVGAKVTAELASAGIRAVAGKEAEQKVRNFFESVDPTKHTNATHAPIKAVASGVKAVSDFFKGGLFKKGK